MKEYFSWLWKVWFGSPVSIIPWLFFIAPFIYGYFAVDPNVCPREVGLLSAVLVFFALPVIVRFGAIK
jgi:hypothetical protein